MPAAIAASRIMSSPRLLGDQTPDLVVDAHHFVDARSGRGSRCGCTPRSRPRGRTTNCAASASAMLSARSVSASGVYCRRQLTQSRRTSRCATTPMSAERDHVGLDPHVRQPRHRRRRVVGVQRGEDEVAGLRGLHRDLRGLLIADLADEDDVGILPQDGAQRARERQLRLLVHLRLVDAGNLVLDRIFDRDDVGASRLDRRDRGAQRRRLAAAGRTDDQDHAVLVVEEEPELLHRAGEKPELLERRRPLAVSRARAERSSRRTASAASRRGSRRPSRLRS